MRSTVLLIAVLAATAPAGAEVVVETATDASRCTPQERAQNAATLRRTLDRLIATHALAANAQIDASIVTLTVEPSAKLVVASARVRLAITDESGRMVSVVTGDAKIEVPRGTRPPQLARMRDDAVTAAVEALFGKVKIALAPTTPTPRRAGNVIGLARPRR